MTYEFSRPRHRKERNAPKIVKPCHLRKTEVNKSELKVNKLKLSNPKGKQRKADNLIR